MKIEHLAYPAKDPVAVAKWYVEHCGLKVVKSTGAPTWTHFLSDGAGGMIEIYNNSAVTVPDYRQMHPLLLHIAFVVRDTPVERERLLKAGCTVAEDTVTSPAGDVLTMLRDPWGFALQLVQRATPIA
jgi:catechol 2,3-dioxygenase-like lactoylglutathione lyase family enzyme